MPADKRILLLTTSEKENTFIPLEENGYLLCIHDAVEDIPSDAANDIADLIILDLSQGDPQINDHYLRFFGQSTIPILGIMSDDNGLPFSIPLQLSDFIYNPFSANELILRVNRILNLNGNSNADSVIRSGDLTIDQIRYEVSVANRKVILTFKEYQLLCLLASNPERVYSRENLLSLIWEYDYFGGTRTVDVHIRRLRAKLEDANHLFIETVRNVGYRYHISKP